MKDPRTSLFPSALSPHPFGRSNKGRVEGLGLAVNKKIPEPQKYVE